MTAAPSIPPGPTRHRAGTLLLIYGIVGVLLMGTLLAVTAAVAFMGRDGFTKVDETIDEVVAVIDSTSAALDQADQTLAGIGTSLTQTAAVVEEASSLASIVAGGAGTLADQVGSFSVLGQNPFAGIEQPLRDMGQSLAALEVRLDAAAASLATNGSDVTVLGEKLGAVSDSLAATRDRLAGVDTQLGASAVLATLVLMAIIGWLMVPALAAIWIGRRWRAENPTA